jgi:hypothetical protein
LGGSKFEVLKGWRDVWEGGVFSLVGGLKGNREEFASGFVIGEEKKEIKT